MKTISYHTIDNLATAQIKNEIILETNPKTELHIVSKEDKTVINLPLGNRFDIINGQIIIHEK